MAEEHVTEAEQTYQREIAALGTGYSGLSSWSAQVEFEEQGGSKISTPVVGADTGVKYFDSRVESQGSDVSSPPPPGLAGWDPSDLDEVEIPKTNVMTQSEAKRALESLVAFAANDIRSVNMKMGDDYGDKLAMALVKYGIVNSGSHQHDFPGDIKFGAGREFPAKCISLAFGQEFRRFLRIYADDARRYLWDRPTLANECASKMHLDSKYKHLAFDFSDGCSGLSVDDRNALERSRRVLTEKANWREMREALRTTDKSGGSKRGKQGGTV